MGAAEERVVRAFMRCTEGSQQDVDGMTALMGDDIVWQVNVPLSGIVTGRRAARAELERQNRRSTGTLPGSEIRTIASNNRTVFTERVDVVDVVGKRVSMQINGIFEVANGKIVAWREYFDSCDLASQLGIDATHLYGDVGTTRD